jgi:hypothetical protein
MAVPSQDLTEPSRSEELSYIRKEYNTLLGCSNVNDYYVDYACKLTVDQWLNRKFYQGNRKIGFTWRFEPFPLSKREERDILKSSRWHTLKGTQFGEYEVAPSRADVKWIQQIYWASREIRATLRIISLNPNKCFIETLRVLRNSINTLGNGSRKRTGLQSKLLSDVYYCLRQCTRLQDSE